MGDKLLGEIKETVNSAMEALEHKNKELGICRSLLVKRKEYDLLCIKAAAFEAIVRKLSKEEEYWWNH